MLVKDIMSTGLVSITPAAYLEEAARLMKRHDIGLLPVMEGDRVAGVLTDRDIVVKALAHGWNPLLTQARVIMNQDIIWCFGDLSAEGAARLMAGKQVHRLLVFNREMDLVGVVSLDDVALALRDTELVGEMLRDIVIPAVAYRAVA